jgi:hypothetical protein
LHRAVPIWEWIRDVSSVISILTFLTKTIRRLRRDSGLLQLLKDSTVLGIVGGVSFLLVTSSGVVGVPAAHSIPNLTYETHSTETWIASASIFGQTSSSVNLIVVLYLSILTILAYPSFRIASTRAIQLMDLWRARKGWLLHNHEVVSAAPKS